MGVRAERWMLGRDILLELGQAEAHLAVKRVAFPSLLVEMISVQGLRVDALDGRGVERRMAAGRKRVPARGVRFVLRLSLGRSGGIVLHLSVFFTHALWPGPRILYSGRPVMRQLGVRIGALLALLRCGTGMGLLPHGKIAAQESGVVLGGRRVQGEEAPLGLPGLLIRPVRSVRIGRGPRLVGGALAGSVSIEAGGGAWGDRWSQVDRRSGLGQRGSG